MSRVILGILFIVVLASSVAFAGGGIHGLAATSVSGKIIVTWTSDDESGVSGYQIERKAGVDGVFISLTEPPLRPTGSGSSYSFEDNTAFRSTGTFYQYRVTAVGTGNVFYVSVSHESVSGVRRTWGSIKAMFR
jgi:hypothetical protein